MRETGFWPAVFLLTGTTIGAGIFGIPFVTAKVGYPVGAVWLVGLSIFVLALNLAYARVIVAARDLGARQLVGYAQHFVGPFGKNLAFVIILFGQWGAILAYLIGIGNFLSLIFGLPGQEQLFSILVFCVVAVLIWFNIKSIATLEGWLTLGMILVIALIVVSGLTRISVNNLLYVPYLSVGQALIPYGVVIGALSGYAILPEVAEVIFAREQVKDKRKARSKAHWIKKQKVLNKAVIVGTLIPAIVYLIFQFIVVGISGLATTEQAIEGLVPFLDIGIIRIGATFGALAMFSSFLTLAYVLKDTFKNDFNFPEFRAWLLSFLPPFLVYLAGLKSFIVALEVTGVWLGTSSAVLIFWMYFRAKSS